MIVILGLLVADLFVLLLAIAVFAVLVVLDRLVVPLLVMFMVGIVPVTHVAIGTR